MIFSRISKGVVVHLPVRLGEKITKKDLYTGAHAVGVLANTTAIFDRLSQTALAPDVYLVKVRAVRKNAWAFDFMQADGRRALSTPANLVDERAFESMSPEFNIYVRLWGCDVYVGPDPDALMRSDGSIPTIVCVSFGAWVHCFGVRDVLTSERYEALCIPSTFTNLPPREDHRGDRVIFKQKRINNGKTEQK